MTIDNPNQLAASAEFTDAIISKLAAGRGVHAETAISAASRMAGTLLLRSSGLPLAGLPAGESIFCDLMDDLGQQLLGLTDQALASLGVQLDPSKCDYDLSEDHLPQMELNEVQHLLDGTFRSIIGRYGLTEKEAAGTAALSTADLIRQCTQVLDPHVGYVIAVYGMVQACKTVPFDSAPDRGAAAA